MSYENAPATKMLATHCCACGRPLVDSVSVEAGMGPDCREKYGYNIEVDGDARAEANKLVHQIAVGMDPAYLLLAILSLRVYGFEKLADTILDRHTSVTLTDVGNGMLQVESNYNEAFVEALKAATPWKKFDRETKTWTVLAGNQKVKNKIWTAMRRNFPGTLGVGPKGPFAIAA